MIVSHLEIGARLCRFARASAYRGPVKGAFIRILYFCPDRESCIGTGTDSFYWIPRKGGAVRFSELPGGRRNPACASSSIIRLRGAPSHLTNVSSRSHCAVSLAHRARERDLAAFVAIGSFNRGKRTHDSEMHEVYVLHNSTNK